MLKKRGLPCFLLFHCFLILVAFSISSSSSSTVHAEGVRAASPVVKKEERRPVISTDYGEISAVRISDGINGSYLLHFFTFEPNSLFLPVVLNADMVFYVHTGSGKLSWAEEDDLKHIELQRGDVYRLPRGTVFFIHCDSGTEAEQQRLRIHAIFANSNDDLREPATGPYSSIQDMVLGFDKKVLQATFKVSEEVIDELLDGTKPAAIVHVDPEWEMEAQFTRSLLESRSSNIFESNKKKKKKKETEKEGARLFNLFKEDKDFENCNGWITTITRKKLSALKGSDIGLFMVNLTTGSMLGPHWNAMATEIAIVVDGRGMVRVVCSSISKGSRDCKNMRFEVEEGDVFAVPRFHPMAQMAFNNGTFVFMGFSTIAERNEPGVLAGQASVLRALDKDVLAMSFNVTSTTVDELLAPQDDDSVILGCTSCAEEELRTMEEEMEEEAGEREEEGETEQEAGGQQGGEKEGRQEEESEAEEEERGGGGGGGGGGGTEEEEQGGRGGGGGGGGGKGGSEGGKEEEEQGGGGTEEEERGGGSGGGSGKGEPRGTELQRENHDDQDEWGRRIGKGKKRLTV